MLISFDNVIQSKFIDVYQISFISIEKNSLELQNLSMKIKQKPTLLVSEECIANKSIRMIWLPHNLHRILFSSVIVMFSHHMPDRFLFEDFVSWYMITFVVIVCIHVILLKEVYRINICRALIFNSSTVNWCLGLNIFLNTFNKFSIIWYILFLSFL